MKLYFLEPMLPKVVFIDAFEVSYFGLKVGALDMLIGVLPDSFKISDWSILLPSADFCSPSEVIMDLLDFCNNDITPSISISDKGSLPFLLKSLQALHWRC